MADVECRMSSAKLRVYGKDGKPLGGAKITVNQIGHEFLFGCGAFESIPYTSGFIPKELNLSDDQKRNSAKNRKTGCRNGSVFLTTARFRSTGVDLSPRKESPTPRF